MGMKGFDGNNDVYNRAEDAGMLVKPLAHQYVQTYLKA